MRKGRRSRGICDARRNPAPTAAAARHNLGTLGQITEHCVTGDVPECACEGEKPEGMECLWRTGCQARSTAGADKVEEVALAELSDWEMTGRLSKGPSTLHWRLHGHRCGSDSPALPLPPSSLRPFSLLRESAIAPAPRPSSSRSASDVFCAARMALKSLTTADAACQLPKCREACTTTHLRAGPPCAAASPVPSLRPPPPT